MEKLNFVWLKAEHELADQPQRLRKLLSDLSTFDTLYLGLKQEAGHKQQSGKDSKGVDPREVDRVDAKLEKLLARYDLDDAIYAFRMRYKYDKSKLYSVSEGEAAEEDGGVNKSKKKEVASFDDPRLVKVWDDVKGDPAFSLQELDGESRWSERLG